MDVPPEKAYASTKRIILTSMILAPLTVFLLAIAIGYYFFATSTERSAIATLERVIRDQRQMIDTFLDERRADLEFVLRSYDYATLSDPRFLARVFERLQEESRAFVDLGVFDEAGVHVAYQGPFPLAGKVYRDTDWFRAVMKTGSYTSDVFLGYRQVPHFIIAVSRKNGSGTWVLRATIDTHYFSRLVEEVRIGATGEAYLLNREGLFQTSPRSGGRLMEKDTAPVEYPPFPDTIHTYLGEDAHGQPTLCATTWLKNKDWLLVVQRERSDAFQALRASSVWIVVIMLVGGAGIVGMAFALTHRVVRKMQQKDTEADRLNLQLIRASRLAELGEMAAGFAHEINNPLQIIQSEQALIEALLGDAKARGDIPPSDDLKEMEDSLAQIKLQLQRAARITASILKFGRKSEPQSRDLDLAAFLDEVTAMIEKKAQVMGIRVKKRSAPDLPQVHGDPVQLQQVFLNLFNNALDAIVERHGASGGELVVDAAPGADGNVTVAVADNGSGIRKENLKKVFTPFFTTKPVGKGTGLGLSVCYGIVDSMGGGMEVESEEGAGTVFILRLPAAR